MCLYYITNQNYFSNIFNVGDFLTLTVILRLCWWLMLHLLHVCMYVYGTKYNLLIIAFSNLLSTDKHVVKNKSNRRYSAIIILHRPMFLSKFPRRYKQCMWPHSNDDTPEAKTLIVSPYYGLVGGEVGCRYYSIVFTQNARRSSFAN